MTAGLIGVVLLASVGGACDLSMQFWANSVAQRAADAAALAGAKELESGTVSSAQAQIQTIAAVNMPASLSAVTFNGVVDQAKGTVTVTASGTMKPAFLPLLDVGSLPIAASSASSIQQKQYSDFYFLLDVSESMNIAASEADRTRLQAITTKEINSPCAFACHEADDSREPPYSIYQMNQMAAGGPARLRIDVARDASDGMIDKLLAYNADSNSLKSMRVATAGFSYAFQVGSLPSTDAAALKSSLRSFTVANSHTNYVAAFDGFNAMIGSQGDGHSQSRPLKMALVITDGVRDTDFSSSGLGPISASLCQTIKSRGITLAVLEIKYVADYDVDDYFRDRVSWYYPNISPSLKDCASAGYYFLAADADDAEAKLIAATDALTSQRRRIVK